MRGRLRGRGARRGGGGLDDGGVGDGMGCAAVSYEGGGSAGAGSYLMSPIFGIGQAVFKHMKYPIPLRLFVELVHLITEQWQFLPRLCQGLPTSLPLLNIRGSVR